ncbi:MAG: Crp/Fnr family transcriptional regulator [Bacteroidia bacterium]|nr:Crp/Fnr family transcriptional regulator [Bacteroidia bacterium]
MALNKTEQELIWGRFSAFFEDGLIQDIINEGLLRKVSKNRIILDIGDDISFMPLVLEGSIKIMRVDPEQNELLLYYLEYGDTCAITLNCCVKKAKSSIRATTEQDSTLVLIPTSKMEEWMQKFHSWRAYVLESYQMRVNELLDSVDSLAFMNMGERLIKYLRDKAMVNNSEEIHITHREIANDLHTSRVVVTRLLKKLEAEQIIEHFRNKIIFKELQV